MWPILSSIGRVSDVDQAYSDPFQYCSGQDVVLVSYMASSPGEAKELAIYIRDWIEASGHYGATFFEHIAFNLQLSGQPVDAATPEQALWSLIVASAAQHSMQTGREVDVGAFCEAEGIGDFYEGH